jgi:hypothetical protein
LPQVAQVLVRVKEQTELNSFFFLEKPTYCEDKNLIPCIYSMFTTIFRQCRDVNDTFSSSVIYKIQEKWAVCLTYRLKALTNWFSMMKAGGLMSIDILTEMKRLTNVVIGEVVR